MATGSGRRAGSRRILYLVSEDWYFCSHRLALARAARDAGFAVSVATREAAHGELIRDEGFDLHPIELRRGDPRPWRDFPALADLAGIYRRVRPDIAHHVALKPVIYGTLAARGAGVGGVANALAGLGFVFASGRPVARVLRPLVRGALALALRGRASHTIVQNPDDEQTVRSLGVSPARIHRIAGSGVDLDLYRPQFEPSGPVVCTLVARMLRDKGVVEFVDAAERLHASGREVVMQLVGGPDPDNPASLDAAQLRAWDAGGVVRWCGPREDIAAIWAESHVAVLPSYREGLPKALLEAAACARPLIATEVPGCREVVRDGETGLLVPARDGAALAAAIERLIDDAALRRRLGANARAMVEREYGIERVIDATLSVYARMLGDRG